MCILEGVILENAAICERIRILSVLATHTQNKKYVHHHFDVFPCIGIPLLIISAAANSKNYFALSYIRKIFFKILGVLEENRKNLYICLLVDIVFCAKSRKRKKLCCDP